MPNQVELLRNLYRFAELNSDDLSNQNAALILDGDEIVSIACNCIPPGVTKTMDRIAQRPKKYAFIEHAERGAIYLAARKGHKLEGTTMVCPWFACADCARAIVLAGITKVIGHKQRMQMTNLGRENVVDTVDNRWTKAVDDGDAILQEAGVELEYYDGPVGPVNILVNEMRVISL